MKHPTWPRTSSSPFSSLPFSNRSEFFTTRLCARPPLPSPPGAGDFSALPYDVLAKIAASFDDPNLRAASLVCRAWCEALRPLREAMALLLWGKRFKHGHRGVGPNPDRALDSFIKAAARGSALAMVDAGLIYWERGEKPKAMEFYHKAAELGNPSAQCNLGLSYLQAEPPNTELAVKWLHKASVCGNVRAQYQLALCLHRGGGRVRSNLKEAVGALSISSPLLIMSEAVNLFFQRGVCVNGLELCLAKWYMKAAEGGYVRAMYNISLCFSFGEGLTRNHQLARKWMKRAADRGHSKAQFEHGLALFSEGDMMKAVVYLELATRAGEKGAAHVKNAVLHRLSSASRDHAMHLANSWRALPSS
ncbi:F-box protein [Glycine soja]|nr:F-box protein [Glycine max]